MNEAEKFVRETMIDLINNEPGIKATKLLTETMDKFYTSSLKDKDSIKGDCDSVGDAFQSIMFDLGKKGEVVEMEYVLPTMNYRIKSLYFPKGTEVKVPHKQTE